MGEKIRVLVVDDDASWRQLLSDALAEDFQVAQADTYRSAIEELVGANPPFHLLVADISLRGGGVDAEGMELIRTLRQFESLTSVIIVTGYPSIKTAKDAFTLLDVFDYLEKYPGQQREFDPDYFLERSRKAIAQAKERRELVSIKRGVKVLVLIEDEATRRNLLNVLTDFSGFSVDASIPDAIFDDKRKILVGEDYDLVIVRVDNPESREDTFTLIKMIHELNPAVEILGVGDYDSGQKLVLDVFTGLGVAGLVDLGDPLAIKQRAQATVVSALKKYIVARFESLGAAEEGVKVGQECHLVVEVVENSPENEAAVAIRFLPVGKTVIRVNTALSFPDGGFEVFPSLAEDIVVYPSGEVKPAKFRLIPTSVGEKEIVLEFYQSGRWQRRLRLKQTVRDDKS